MVSIAFEIRNLHRNALHGLLKALAVVAAVSLSFSSHCFAGDSQSISNWQGESLDGRVLSFVDDSQAKVIFFLGVECPVARHYAAQLQALSVEFQGQPITFVGIDSNIQDSEDELKKLAQDLQLTFPIVCDVDQSLAKTLNATRTGEVLVLDDKRKTVYQGRFDDQYSPGIKRTAPTKTELRNAILQVLAGEPVLVSKTEPVGCLITFLKPTIVLADQRGSTTTYCKDIAPILYQHCVECHRPGDIGPFDVSDYDEARGWAEMMIETIEQGRMPPWHASPEHGTFKNARSVSKDIALPIRAWIEAGTPYGNSKQLPELPPKTEGWRLPREPDLVVEMSDEAFKVPANGTVEYQYFVVDPKLQEDRWISAAEVIPGNASIVHHAIVFVRPPDGEAFQGIGWLTAFVPGQRAMVFPEGFARRIPAGSKFVFQMHYTPNGVKHSDMSKIGLNFIDASQVTDEVFTLVGIDQEFEIPPGAENHQVNGNVRWLPRDGSLLAVMPHMHLRGKAFELRATSGGNSSTLLHVPRYDFNWQHTYELSKPLSFQEVDRLEFTAVFDNSSANPFNPNPEEFVMWGDQTWEEMAVSFFEVARPIKRTDDSNSLGSPDNDNDNVNDSKKNEDSDVRIDPKAAEAVERLLAKFDTNGDKCISLAEGNRIFQDYAFSRFDQDGNGILSQEELTRKFRERSGK